MTLPLERLALGGRYQPDRKQEEGEGGRRREREGGKGGREREEMEGEGWRKRMREGEEEE